MVGQRVLVVDAANVVGSRPDGWWKDRAGAARRLHERLLTADLDFEEIVLVLEGQAKAGVAAGTDVHVRVVHAPRDGDTTIREVTRKAAEEGADVTVVTRDRALAGACEHAGARLVMSPQWLWSQVE